MPSSCRAAQISIRGALAAALALVAAGCDGAPRAARAERDELEGALSAFADAPPEDRALRLEQLEALKLEDAETRRVRDLCATAYRSFFEAMERFAEVKAQAAEVTAETHKAAVGRPDASAAITKIQRAALRGTADVSAALDRAEQLVDDCTRARAALAGKARE